MATGVQEERLEGENQYDAEKLGKQDAGRRAQLFKLPPVLQLHLMRFQFDYETGCSFKARAPPGSALASVAPHACMCREAAAARLNTPRLLAASPTV